MLCSPVPSAFVTLSFGSSSWSPKRSRHSPRQLSVFQSPARGTLKVASSLDANEHEDLGSAFGQYINTLGVSPLLANRRPTHLLPPTSVVASLMDALQRNDWPEADAGVRVAWAFSKPHALQEASPSVAPPAPAVRVRSWGAAEVYLGWQEFRQLLHGPNYSQLLNCSGWKPASGLVFPSQRFEHKAVMAVVVEGGEEEVGAGREGPGGAGSMHGSSSSRHIFTFCLERVDEGALKGCWLVVGVRQGEYANM